ncbi:MAG: hypothetical protein KDD45_05240, partial [Bdellovibrionales bacterium]|nr:hypothetical protein [Bdellovibrionales bacterium]
QNHQQAKQTQMNSGRKIGRNNMEIPYSPAFAPNNFNVNVNVSINESSSNPVPVIHSEGASSDKLLYCNKK